jgi:hypothetical protein
MKVLDVFVGKLSSGVEAPPSSHSFIWRLKPPPPKESPETAETFLIKRSCVRAVDGAENPQLTQLCASSRLQMVVPSFSDISFGDPDTIDRILFFARDFHEGVTRGNFLGMCD